MTALRPAPTPAMSAARRWAALAVLSTSLLVVVMDMTILNVAIPAIVTSVGADGVAQLWIVDSYALVLAAFIVPVTALGDRWGRRRMLLLGFTVFAVASTLVLVAESAASLIALRAALGLAGAAIMPSTLSLIRAVFPDPRERAFALSVWGGTAAVGTALGPVVGGALLAVWSWHAAFLVNVPVMVVAVVAALVLVPEDRSSRPGRIDPTGVLLSVVGMTGTVYAVKHLGGGEVDAVGLVALVAGVAGLALFVRRCLRQDAPMLAVGLVRIRAFRAGVVTAVAASSALAALLFVGSQWLQVVRGLTPLQAGLALVPLAVGGVVASPGAPALARRVGVRTVMAGGLLLLGLGLLALAALPHPLAYAGVAVAFGVVGLGTGVLGLGSAVIMTSAPAEHSGSAAAIEEMSYEIGAVLGIAVLGTLTAAVYRAGLPAGVDAAVRESVAAATGTAAQVSAHAAFTDAVAAVGLAGGVVAVLAAFAVWRLLPRDLRLDAH